MNFYSFRFYVIFIVIIECSEKYFDGKQYVRVGKLYLVDLAVIIFLYFKRYLFFLFINMVNGYMKEYKNLYKNDFNKKF